MDEAREGLSEITQWSIRFNNTSYSAGAAVIAAMLTLSLAFVVFSLATNKNNAWSYLIAWFVVLVFVIAFVLK